MRKSYRISVYNRTADRRELMYERYTSKKKAQEMADAMNRVDAKVDARVMVEIG